LVRPRRKSDYVNIRVLKQKRREERKGAFKAILRFGRYKEWNATWKNGRSPAEWSSGQISAVLPLIRTVNVSDSLRGKNSEREKPNERRLQLP